MNRPSGLPVKRKSAIPTRTADFKRRAPQENTFTSYEPLADRIPLKSIPFIINYFDQLNIILDQEDLVSPQPYQIQTLYYVLLELIVPKRIYALQVERDELKEIRYDEIYAQETIEVQSIFKEFRALLHQISSVEVQLFDLTSPTKDRTQLILTAIIHFLTQKEEYSHNFEHNLSESDLLANEARELEAQLEELLTIQSEMEPKSIQEELQSEQLERENEEIEETLRQYRIETEELANQLHEFKAGRFQLKDSLQSVHYEMIAISKENEVLKEYVQIDVDKYENDIKHFQSSIQMYKTEEDKFKEDIPQLERSVLLYKNRISDAAVCAELLEKLKIVKGDTNRHRKTNNAINQEILQLKAELADVEGRISAARQAVEHHIGKIEQVKTQHQKKREAMDEYFKNSDARRLEANRIVNEKYEEAEECEKLRFELEEQMEALQVEHRQIMDQLQSEYFILSSLLNDSYQDIARHVAVFEK